MRVRWKRTLGAGYSGVVVADGKAVTMYSDGKNDYVVALSSDTGEEQWKFLLGEAFPPRDGSSGGPVSTPAIDRGVVYALGPRGNFVALNLATGKKLWQHDLVAELERTHSALGLHNITFGGCKSCRCAHRWNSRTPGHCIRL